MSPSAALREHHARPNWPAVVALYGTRTPADTDGAVTVARAVLAKADLAWSYVGQRVSDVGPRSKDALTGAMSAPDYALAVLANSASTEQLAGLVTELGSALQPLAPAGAQPLVIRGQQYLVREGDFPLVAVCTVRRLGSLTRAQFQQHWRDTHAAIAYRFPGGCGYRQLHTALAEGGDAEYYDGVTTMHYPDVAFMRRGLEEPDFLREVAADELRFLDHARSSVLFFHDPAREPGGRAERLSRG